MGCLNYCVYVLHKLRLSSSMLLLLSGKPWQGVFHNTIINSLHVEFFYNPLSSHPYLFFMMLLFTKVYWAIEMMGECFSTVAVVVFVILPMLFARTFSAVDPSPFDMLACTWS